MNKKVLFSGVFALFLAGFLFIAATPSNTSDATNPEVTECVDDVKCDCSLATATVKFKVVSAVGSCYKITLCTGGSYGAVSCTPLQAGKLYKACIRRATNPTFCVFPVRIEVLYAEEAPNC